MRSWITATVGLLATCSMAAEPGCGDAKGRIALDGVPPKPGMLPGVIGGAQVLDGSLLVDPVTNGVANALVWVPKVEFGRVPAELMKPPAESVDLDIVGDAFVPHALVVRAGQDLRLLNSDPRGHQIHLNTIHGRPFNVLVNANERMGVLRRVDPEILPTSVKDHVYPWMSAHLLVLEHPYGAVSDPDGGFVIKNLPAGEHRLRFWHERAGYFEKGRSVRVRDGETTDLGEINFKPK
jgi:hypothetical protein